MKGGRSRSAGWGLAAAAGLLNWAGAFGATAVAFGFGTAAGGAAVALGTKGAFGIVAALADATLAWNGTTGAADGGESILALATGRCCAIPGLDGLDLADGGGGAAGAAAIAGVPRAAPRAQ